MSGGADTPGAELHLGFWMLTSGGHVASWRHPATQTSRLMTIEHYADTARLAARGKFDMVFFEDTLAAREGHGGQILGEASINSLDPVVQIAALAGATRDIGLAASYSTTYHAPRVLADKYMTVDRLSGGRAGWNMVTSGNAAGRNFGSGAHPEHEARYGKAHEVVETVKALWAEAGPSPQGRPVLIQAGMSQWGLDFASSYGEAIFAAFRTAQDGQAFRTNLRSAAMAKGRPADAVRVLPGFMPILGSTAKEVAEKKAFYRELVHPALLRGLLSEQFNFDFSHVPFDKPFPLDEILPTLEERPMIGGTRERFVKDIREGETVGAYAERLAARITGHLSAEGGPEAIADFMETWLKSGACDGFIMQALQIPLELDAFVNEVVPVLQSRGVFRTDYRGSTLRAHLDLPAAA